MEKNSTAIVWEQSLIEIRICITQFDLSPSIRIRIETKQIINIFLTYILAHHLGLSLLEYQAMPSLRDVVHDGASDVVRQGRRHRPSITYKTTSHPAGSLSSSQTGGPPCWASPLAFGLHGVHGRRQNRVSLCWCGLGYSVCKQTEIEIKGCGSVCNKHNSDCSSYLWNHGGGGERGRRGGGVESYGKGALWKLVKLGKVLRRYEEI